MEGRLKLLLVLSLVLTSVTPAFAGRGHPRDNVPAITNGKALSQLERAVWATHAIPVNQVTSEGGATMLPESDGRWVAEVHPADQTTMIVHHVGTQQPTVTHRLLHGTVDNVWFSEKTAIIAELGDTVQTDLQPHVQGYQIDLITGQESPILPPVGHAFASGSQWSVSGNTVAYTTLGADKACLGSVNLLNGVQKTIWCNDPRFPPDRVVLDGDTIGFRANAPLRGKSTCRRLYTGTLSAVTELKPHKPCWGFDVASVAGGVAWTEQDPKTLFPEVGTLYLRAANNVVYSEDQAKVGSIRSCHGWIYWNVSRHSQDGREHLHRWQPGHSPQQILVAKTDSILSSITCHANGISYLLADMSTADSRDQLFVHDPGGPMPLK